MFEGAIVVREMVATTFEEWLEVQGLEWSDETEKECDIVTQIISLQVSRFILRRTNYMDQSLLDMGIQPMIQEKKREYESTFGKAYFDPNSKVDW